MRTLINETKKNLGLNIQVLSSDAVVNGNSIDLTGFNAVTSSIEVLLISGVVTAGTIEVKDFQFSSVSDFSSDVSTIDINNYQDHLSKGDSSSDIDAITQTVIDSSNTFKKIGIHSPFVKKYFRVRFETKASANLTAGCVVSLKMLETPVNQ